MLHHQENDRREIIFNNFGFSPKSQMESFIWAKPILHQTYIKIGKWAQRSSSLDIRTDLYSIFWRETLWRIQLVINAHLYLEADTSTQTPLCQISSWDTFFSPLGVIFSPFTPLPYSGLKDYKDVETIFYRHFSICPVSFQPSPGAILWEGNGASGTSVFLLMPLTCTLFQA